MHDDYVLAGDVGGTNLRVAAVAADGSILHEVSSSTPRTEPAQAVIDEIIRAAQACVDQLRIAVVRSLRLAMARSVNSATASR
jgi:predicted NBD/HSP70 family sugar kinase